MGLSGALARETGTVGKARGKRDPRIRGKEDVLGLGAHFPRRHGSVLLADLLVFGILVGHDSTLIISPALTYRSLSSNGGLCWSPHALKQVQVPCEGTPTRAEEGWVSAQVSRCSKA